MPPPKEEGVEDTLHAAPIPASVHAPSVAPPVVDMHAPHHVGREEIGRGGMGTVHRVHDTRLRRDVAMKLVSPALEHSRTHLEDFVEEARIAGQLEHPNIIPIHELGLDADGHAYFTMKLVRGRNLSDWLRDPQRPVGTPERIQDALEIFIKVCDAISFAHSRGVVHRDLKPDNVMVGEFGEVYLSDWGLAKVTDKSTALTPTPSPADLDGAAVGTPGFMAPEQASGRFDEQDERTDVFGLGTILYVIVTGKAPYAPATTFSDRAAVEGAYIPPQVALGHVQVSANLLYILKKALSRDRADRHASAAHLKADVQQFVRGGLHLPRVNFKPGEKIIVEGDAGNAAYIIARGECVAYRMVGGERKVLRRMVRGDVFGELAILSHVPRTATVEAVDSVAVLVVTRALLDEELGADSWVGALVRALSDRFREIDAQV
jgi:tRNA A-37 threonylcarbamoyl transferase component Bud32